MRNDQTGGEMTASHGEQAGSGPGGPRLSRRQALGRVSAVATAGAAAWVVPEILTAKPAAGASLSGTTGTTGTTGTGTGVSVGVGTSPGTTGGAGGASTGASVAGSPRSTDGSGSGSGASSSPSALAFTGLDIKRDAEVGAAMIAGGWAMHHWASRTPRPNLAVDAQSEAGSTDTVR
jgi:hypothetical protein